MLFQEDATVSGACRPNDFPGWLRTNLGCLTKGRLDGPNRTCRRKLPHLRDM